MGHQQAPQFASRLLRILQRPLTFALGFISPLDLVAIGMVSAEEAQELHEMETKSQASAAKA